MAEIVKPNQRLKILNNIGRLITPSECSKWPEGKLWRVANAAANLIEVRADGNMFKYSPTDLIPYLAHQHAALVTSPDANQLYAFAKLYPWHYRDGGEHPVHKSIYGQQPGVIELGALCVTEEQQGKGFAYELVCNLAIQSSCLYPNIPLVAVVVCSNNRSQALFRSQPNWSTVDPNKFPINLLKGWKPESDVFEYNDN